MGELTEISGVARRGPPAAWGPAPGQWWTDGEVEARRAAGLFTPYKPLPDPRRMPVPHDPETGAPTDEGWRELGRVWGIRRD